MSEEEIENKRLHNLARFSPFQYQLKKSTGASGQFQSMQSELVGQEVGYYPYPKGDTRETKNYKEVESPEKINKPHNGVCFCTRKLL